MGNLQELPGYRFAARHLVLNVDSERELSNQSKLCKMEGFTDFIWAIFYLTLWFNSICGISTFVLKIREMVAARKAKSTEAGGEQVDCSDTASTG